MNRGTSRRDARLQANRQPDDILFLKRRCAVVDDSSGKLDGACVRARGNKMKAGNKNPYCKRRQLF